MLIIKYAPSVISFSKRATLLPSISKTQPTIPAKMMTCKMLPCARASIGFSGNQETMVSTKLKSTVFSIVCDSKEEIEFFPGATILVQIIPIAVAIIEVDKERREVVAKEDDPYMKMFINSIYLYVMNQYSHLGSGMQTYSNY